MLKNKPRYILFINVDNESLETIIKNIEVVSIHYGVKLDKEKYCMSYDIENKSLRVSLPQMKWSFPMHHYSYEYVMYDCMTGELIDFIGRIKGYK